MYMYTHSIYNKCICICIYTYIYIYICHELKSWRKTKSQLKQRLACLGCLVIVQLGCCYRPHIGYVFFNDIDIAQYSDQECQRGAGPVAGPQELPYAPPSI